MAFKHTHVSLIEKASAALRAAIANHTEAYGPATFDGMVVQGNLAALCHQIRRIDHRFKFGTNYSIPRTLTDIHVYMEGDEFAPVRISYGMLVKSKYTNVFGVAARTVANNKDNEESSQYNILMSKDMGRALKNFKKAYRAYRLDEIAEMTFEPYVLRELYSRKHQRDILVQNAWSSIANSSALASELMSMLTSGYAFNNPTLKTKIEEWVAKSNEYNAIAGIPVHAMYVKVVVEDGVQKFKTLRTYDVTNHASWEDRSKVEETYTAETMPEDVMLKLASLSMVEPHNYVEGLGTKISDDSFWVVL